MKFPIPLAVSVSLIVLPLRSSDSSVESQLPLDATEALKVICDEFAAEIMPSIMEFDHDGDGLVQLRALAVELMGRGFAKKDHRVPEGADEKARSTFERSQEWHASTDREVIKRIGTDDEGNVLEAGVSRMIQETILKYLNRMGPLDANKDDRLDLQEYAVSFPVTEDDRRDEEGFTEEQREWFAKQDADGDGYIQGAEYVNRESGWIGEHIDEFIVILSIHRADTNGDKVLSNKELAIIVPELEELPESVPMSESVFWIRELEHEVMENLRRKLTEGISNT